MSAASLRELFQIAADIAASRRDESGATKRRSHTRRGPGIMPHHKGNSTRTKRVRP